MLEYKNDRWKALLALAPMLILMAVFTFYPIVNTLLTAFMDGYTAGVWHDVFRSDGTIETHGWLDHFGKTIVDPMWAPNEETGVMEVIGETRTYLGFGIESFKTVFKDPNFWAALKNTSIMVFISVPLTVIVGLLIAVALNNVKKFQSLFQIIFFLPYVTNTIALGLVFSVMFSSDAGLINSVIIALGGKPIAWIRPLTIAIGETQTPTYFTCMFVLMIYTIWNGLAFKILVFLSGMQSIDKQYYQAAQIDATPRWRVFRRITVPLLSPMIAYITITSFIGAFKVYTSVKAVFNGNYGPASNPKMLITVVGYTYDILALKTNTGALGKASASALILFAIIMLITVVQNYVNKKKVHY